MLSIEFHLEEESAEDGLKAIVPRIICNRALVKFVVYQGKQDLLRKLPSRLRGYRSAGIQSDFRIVVLVDEDGQNCVDLKSRLEKSALSAGLATKSSPDVSGNFTVLNRIAVEELESWFFGDVAALREVFPRVSATLDKKARFRVPDLIANPSEALADVLCKAGYSPASLSKRYVARLVGGKMNPYSNRSKSFQVFRDGLLSL
jgi:hypothetical protein